MQESVQSDVLLVMRLLKAFLKDAGNRSQISVFAFPLLRRIHEDDRNSNIHHILFIINNERKNCASFEIETFSSVVT